MNDKLKVTGHVKLFLDGKLIREGKNLVTTAGMELIAEILGGAATKPSHMAIGSSSTAAALAQTTLVGTEHQRKTVTRSFTGRIFKVTSAAFGPGLGGTVNVQEVGVFNNSPGGVMLCRFTCAAFDLLTTSSLVVEWSLTIGD